MANIYELTEEFRTLWNLLDEGEITDEVLAEVFETTTEELAIKLEGYCKFIKNVEGDIAALKAEEHRLENTVDRAKSAMMTALKTAGENNLPCGTFKVAIQANPPKVVIDEPYVENIPDRYLVAQEPTIDKKAILADLKAGDVKDLEGIAHLERGESLRIK